VDVAMGARAAEYSGARGRLAEAQARLSRVDEAVASRTNDLALLSDRLAGVREEVEEHGRGMDGSLKVRGLREALAGLRREVGRSSLNVAISLGFQQFPPMK